MAIIIRRMSPLSGAIGHACGSLAASTMGPSTATTQPVCSPVARCWDGSHCDTDTLCTACRALPVWLGLGALHLGLGLALKLYFFQYWSS